MTAAVLTRPTAPDVRPNRTLTARQTRPAKPDPQLWKTNAEKAFEVGMRWFLAVSRSA